MVVKNTSKNIKKFFCEICDFECCKKGDYTRHLSTRKHKMVVNGSNIPDKNIKKYFCECGKSYTHDSGYYRHKKTCTFINEKKETNNGENVVTPEMFMELMKVVVKQGEQQMKHGEQVINMQQQQSEFMKEIIPKIGNTTNNTNTNCNNTTNKFNMNIFLNETCKDAIPLVEFVNNLKLTVEDLDNTGKDGIVKGLTDIITKGLNELDITKRPIHCSDIKRETLYIKDEDKWIKDDKDKTIVSDAIGKVKQEANNFFPKWLDEHPNCWKEDSPYHEQYMTMVTNRFGKGDEDFQEKNTKKVLKNIIKEVVVDKEPND